MKQIISLLALISLTIICSCTKESMNCDENISGNWVWKNSKSSANAQMLSNDTTKRFVIQFNSNNSFVNEASCIMGGPTSGNYQVMNFDNGKILILTAPNYQPDTLNLSSTTSTLTLTETSNGYAWHHYFEKK